MPQPEKAMEGPWKVAANMTGWAKCIPNFPKPYQSWFVDCSRLLSYFLLFLAQSERSKGNGCMVFQRIWPQKNPNRLFLYVFYHIFQMISPQIILNPWCLGFKGRGVLYAGRLELGSGKQQPQAGSIYSNLEIEVVKCYYLFKERSQVNWSCSSLRLVATCGYPIW